MSSFVNAEFLPQGGPGNLAFSFHFGQLLNDLT